MKKTDSRKFQPGMVEYVIAHTKWRRQRGKNPSAQLFGVGNPIKALRLANREADKRKSSEFDFYFDFDFSTFSQWDKSVSVEQFKKLVNEAANIADGILGELFIKTVEQLDYPKNVKKMVLLFLVGEKEVALI